MKTMIETRPKATLALLLLWALPAVVQAQFNYTTNNGTITITGYTGPGGAVTIPAIITGLPVTSIGASAFYQCASLTTVAIPNSVTSIGGYAFYRCGLTSVTIPNSVTSIREGVFYDCGLTNVTLGNSVTSIGDYAFYNCGLTRITLGNSVTNIGNSAFSRCYALTSATLGNSVTSISDSAFSWCNGLTSVTIGNSVTSIGVGAFYGCNGLSSLTIPTSVTNIGDLAFAFCSPTNITIPTSVINIGYQAFYQCASLTTVFIPNSVTSIGDGAFSYCSKLTSIYFQGNAPILGGTSVFYGANNATVFYVPGITGWWPTFGGRPTALWFLPNPLILSSGSSFGRQTNGFGFIISWATNIPVVVEASTTLINPPGLWSARTPSTTERLISAIRSGQIIPIASTASARRDAVYWRIVFGFPP